MPFSFTVEVQHTAVLIAIFILDYANISKFLNRLLGLEVSLQNALFQYFTNTLEAVILQAKRNGRYDEGILGWYFLKLNKLCYESSSKTGYYRRLTPLKHRLRHLKFAC